jgi:nucleoside diphosphate kinase
MEWLTPLTGLYAAAVTVPLLLLLYFLKLKRREQVISSTLLWKRAIQDLQVNAPFQKLRRNILLLLQLLMLLAMLFALAGPVLSLTSGPARRYVLLIDRSASMKATDAGNDWQDGGNVPSPGGVTRLDSVKEQARTFTESIRSKGMFALTDRSDQVMIIAFDDKAKVMCNFTSDKHQLTAAIDSITATDGGSSLAEAVAVARAFAQSPGTEASNRSAQSPAQLMLFSDGQIADVGQIVVGKDELLFNCVGNSSRNIAITAMQARRSYENPQEVSVFATIANYSSEQVAIDVQLSINGNVRAVRSVTIEAMAGATASEASRPGRVSVDFSLSQSAEAVIEIRQLQPDFLAGDDAAWAIIPPPKQVSVLLVTRGNAVLRSALQACPLARLDVLSPDQFDSADDSTAATRTGYDVIVLDDHVPSELARGRYLIFGAVPDGIDVSEIGELENQIIADWQPRHPVLQYVNLNNLFAAKCSKMSVPRDAQVLAEFNEGPALVLLRRKGSVFLLAGFDILDTNWPFEPSFVLFCYNATAFLGTQAGQDQETDLRVGEPIIIDGLTPETVATISGPGFPDETISATASGSIRFPSIETAGVYSVNIPNRRERLFAANLLDPKESNIRPRREIVLSGEPVKAQDSPVGRGNVPLWPLLVLFALVIAFLEWLIYNSKVRL